MQTDRTEAICLNSLPFRERSQISTLFTPRWGLIRCIDKSGGKHRLNPLTHVECVLEVKEQGLQKCREIQILSYYPELRETLPLLRAAGEMGQTVLQTQHPHRPAPKLFALLVAYLNQLKKCKNPFTLSTSFALKTLVHEGLWSENHLLKGDFSIEEIEKIALLTYSRAFEPLFSLQIDEKLIKKVKKWLQNMSKD